MRLVAALKAVRAKRSASLLALAVALTFAAAAIVIVIVRPAQQHADAGSAATWTKGPFLQGLGSTGVTVKMELSEAATVVLEVSGPAGFQRSVEARDAKRFQTVRVDGLLASTTYSYRVVAVGSAASPGAAASPVPGAAASPGAEAARGSFTTAPDEKDGRPFRFIAYGDSRSDHAAHAAVVRAIEAVPSDFLVNTGDMVHTGSDERDWQTFFEIERELLRDRCVFAAVGNHELTTPDPTGRLAFLRYFGSTGEGGAERAVLYGTFRWSNARVFLLNAMDAWTGEDKRWLSDELTRSLEEPGLAHRFAVLHHGPFSSGPHGGNRRLFDAGVLDLMRDHRVSLVLSGHDHTYERGEGGGLKYIVTGGAGAPLYPRKGGSATAHVFESVHHFVEVSVNGELVEAVAHRASGGVIERCSFVGAGAWSCGS